MLTAFSLFFTAFSIQQISYQQHKGLSVKGLGFALVRNELFYNIINQLAKNAFHTQGPKFEELKLKQSDVHNLNFDSFKSCCFKKQCTLQLCNSKALGLLVNMPEGLREDPYLYRLSYPL